MSTLREALKRAKGTNAGQRVERSRHEGDNAILSRRQLLVGTYTEDMPHVYGRGAGLLGAWLDVRDPSIDNYVTLGKCRNPSYVATSADGGSVYVVNETFDFQGAYGGGLTAYRRDQTTGVLERLNSMPTGGALPAHLCVSPDDRFVLVANYMSGSVCVYPLGADGSLRPKAFEAQHSGASCANPQRQEAPHPHMVCFDPVTGHVLVPDLGLDAILVYRLEASGKLVELRDHRLTTPPGSGPRHVAFHPNGRYLFVVTELDNTVLVLRRAGVGFAHVSSSSTLPDGYVGLSSAAAIRVTPSGCHVLVSNRGHDSVNMLHFYEDTAQLSSCYIERVHGQEPRDIQLTPDGRHLLAATQDGRINIFRLDEEHCQLAFRSQSPLPSPACLVFAP